MAAVHFNEILPLVIGYLNEADTATGGSDRLEQIRAYIHKHLADPDLSVARMAQLQGVTPRQVQKLFQTEGTTFSKYLLDCRLAAARNAILQSGEERPISTIAYEVGFGDLSYFNRTFRRHFGQSPSQLRKGGMH